ncbi:type II toxin-antitoxin system RelE/ParE family toxin [Caulobacter sp.]|uniref:type II toxin-antitoxin system RelE/ParE family toxin n=1 Tax=Caulobacter sp. TaxID=78 RepID=UPI003BAEAFD3
MIEVQVTDEFTAWFEGLKDARAVHAITARLTRFSYGLMGDVRPIGEGISEARVHYGPGFRIYFVRRGDMLIVVLCGGDKRTQDRDIEKAKALASGL